MFIPHMKYLQYAHFIKIVLRPNNSTRVPDLLKNHKHLVDSRLRQQRGNGAITVSDYCRRGGGTLAFGDGGVQIKKVNIREVENVQWGQRRAFYSAEQLVHREVEWDSQKEEVEGGQLCKDKWGGGEVSDKAVSASSPLPPLSHTVTAKNTETMKVRADGLMKSGGETSKKNNKLFPQFQVYEIIISIIITDENSPEFISPFSSTALKYTVSSYTLWIIKHISTAEW